MCGAKLAAYRKPLSPVRIGAPLDVLCRSVDVEQWRQLCRMDLVPGEWNTWALVRTTSDGLPRDRLLDAARAALRFWFSAELGKSPVRIGNADNLELQPFSDNRLFPTIGEDRPADLVGPLETIFDSDCARVPGFPEIRLDDGSILTETPLVENLTNGVLVSFVWRGKAESMPWPALSAPLGVSRVAAGAWCPVNATWLATSRYSRPGVPVPPETVGTKDDFFGDLAEPLRKSAETIGDIATKLLIAAGLILGGVVVAGAAVK